MVLKVAPEWFNFPLLPHPEIPMLRLVILKCGRAFAGNADRTGLNHNSTK